MYWLDNDSGVADMPEIPAAKTEAPQWYTEGGSGLAPAYPGAHWYNIVQAELLNILDAAGIQPDKSKLNQLVSAITILAGNQVPEIDGAIAYRDKENAFLEDNKFSKRLFLSENSFLSGSDDDRIFINSSAGVAVAVSNISGLKIVVGNQAFTVWNDGNLNPVRSVNGNGPDQNGNVSVNVDLSNYYTKNEVDALMANSASPVVGAVRSYGLFTTKSANASFEEGESVSGSSLLFASLYLSNDGDAHMVASQGSSPAGIWKIMSPVQSVNLKNANIFLAVRTS